MEIKFEKMAMAHREGIIDIFNYYIENSFSAYPEHRLPYEYFDKFMEMTKGYPSFTIIADSKIAGFCFLRAYNQSSSFKECAEITYFIEKDHTGKGIGKAALAYLENEARQRGIRTILASISSLNKESLAFHKKNGFTRCGRFVRIGQKKGRKFDVIWMQKEIR